MAWAALHLEIAAEFGELSAYARMDEALERRAAWIADHQREYHRDRYRLPWIRKKVLASIKESKRRLDAQVRAIRAARPAIEIPPVGRPAHLEARAQRSGSWRYRAASPEPR